MLLGLRRDEDGGRVASEGNDRVSIRCPGTVASEGRRSTTAIRSPGRAASAGSWGVQAIVARDKNRNTSTTETQRIEPFVEIGGLPQWSQIEFIYQQVYNPRRRKARMPRQSSDNDARITNAHDEGRE